MTRRFARGSGRYSCVNCGHRTRETGHEEGQVRLCAFCKRVIELENSLADGLISDGEFDVRITALEERYGRTR